MDDPRLPAFHRRRPPLRAIETVLLASTACLLAAVAWPIARGTPQPTSGAPVHDTPAEGPTIQIAILLDTSGSMDGLLDQARSRLWSVVNSLDSATFHGAKPRFEVALYEYGNDGIPAAEGHLRRIVGFTSELDRVSQALFSLHTNGGSEYAPLAIRRALDELEWKRGEGVMRVVYVAGNESFEQGPASWREALGEAKARGVVVNAIYCGGADDHDSPLWRDAAALAGGRFFAIDQDHAVAEVPAPQDGEIAELGAAINETYIPYGAEGMAGLVNQREQDNNNSVSRSGSIARTITKGSIHYKNPSWDLVDAIDEDGVDLGELDTSALPTALRGLDAGSLAAHVASRKAERAAIQARLAELRREREAFLSASRASATPAAQGLDAAMITALHDHARTSGFTLAER